MAFWDKLFTEVNIFIFRQTRGRLGSQMGHQSVLLLHTTGRKTGRQRLTTVSYYRDRDNYLVVASNWGRESHPGWYFNLLQQPRITIQVGAEVIQVEARAAQGDEYQRLWVLVTGKNDQYIRYQAKIKRRIPIVMLTPVSASGKKPS